MDIRKMYQDKLVSAERSGKNRQNPATGSITPGLPALRWLWMRRSPKGLPELYNVNFRGGILMWVPEIFKIENPADHFTWNSWHMSGIERKAIAQGFAFYGPMRYSELPRFYRDMSEANRPDVAIFQVAPMDEHGYL